MFKARRSSDTEGERILAICPITKQAVIGTLWQHTFAAEYRFPNKQMIWWHCDTCQNWHALLRDT